MGCPQVESPVMHQQSANTRTIVQKKNSEKALRENLNRFFRGLPLPEVKNGLCAGYSEKKKKWNLWKHAFVLQIPKLFSWRFGHGPMWQQAQQRALCFLLFPALIRWRGHRILDWQCSIRFSRFCTSTSWNPSPPLFPTSQHNHFLNKLLMTKPTLMQCTTHRSGSDGAFGYTKVKGWPQAQGRSSSSSQREVSCIQQEVQQEVQR